ncbi:MAG: ATP phosphoribosyltransferase regulatory subunit [Eggerthellaceae bacterium]|nr:ATP phosphoribosyltransferase regulatory subunit [Eggerthellaceae bacterium]
MEIKDSVITNAEKIIFALRSLYSEKGYTPYRMSKFEEYDLYARNKDFLVSDNVITFTDVSGKLMALKPDVTLSIIKNSKDNPEQTQKLFYNENVYRVSKASGGFKELMQAGVECFGKVDKQAICEVILLAAQSLALLSEESVLCVSDLDIVDTILSKYNVSYERLYKAMGEKNLPEIEKLCDADDAALLEGLLSAYGPIDRNIDVLDKLLADSFVNANGAYDKFKSTL